MAECFFINFNRIYHSYGELAITMKRVCKISILVVLAFSILFSALTTSAYAITGNYAEDEYRHPYVCLVGFYDENYEWLWRGSGSLISPTVVLTAGHATEGATYATIWIDEEIPYDPENPDPEGYPNYGKGAADGVAYTHPDFAQYVSNYGLFGFITNDVGIVVLDEPVDLDKYGEVASVGTVDALKVGTDVSFVGYGVQYQVTPKVGGPYYAWTGTRARFYATAKTLSNKFAISSTFMMCSANAAQGKGGTAFGDSGGPVLLRDTDTILAVTSFGPDANCAAVGYYARVDTEAVSDWIATFLS
jgi:V8-like Glu-specific endopeptidase